MNKRIKKLKKAGHQWLTPIILATEIGKINLLGREFLQDPMSTEKGWACTANVPDNICELALIYLG
jgi:hypothetical protein